MGQFQLRPLVRASLALLVALGSSIAFPKNGVHGSDLSGELLAPPVVQLGDRALNGSNSFAIVWQSADTDHPFKVRMSQDALHKFAKITYRTVKGRGVEPHRIYTAEFRGYEPGVPLTYEIVDGDSVLFSATIKPPKSDEQAYKFAVFGESGGSPIEPQISYQVYQQKPDLVLLTGELRYPDEGDPSDGSDLWPYYTSSVASPEKGSPLFSSVLVVANPGSQDDYYRDLDFSPASLAYFYEWSQPLNGPALHEGDASAPKLHGSAVNKAAFRASAGANYPRMASFSFNYSNAHFVCLDAHRYANWSDSKLRAWLRADLEKARGKAWRFVMFHESYYWGEEHWHPGLMRLLSDIFQEEHVDVVFIGDEQMPGRTLPIQILGSASARDDLVKPSVNIDTGFDGVTNTRPKGVIYAFDGDAIGMIDDPALDHQLENFRPIRANQYHPLSFSVVDIKSNRLNFRQLDRNGNQVDGFTITK